ncbi:MAG: hypothetical protein ACOC95_01260 [Planctomycetota bacterium]
MVRKHQSVLLMVLVATLAPTSPVAEAATWAEVQRIKVSQLEKAAAHAVAQQRKTQLEPHPVEADFQGIGGVLVARSTAWDVDGDGECLKVTLPRIPANHSHTDIDHRLAIRFKETKNLLSRSTGLALWIRPAEDLAPTLRFGAHFKCEGTDEDPVIIADTPLVHKFGDRPHQAYLDWGYAFGHEVRPLKGAPRTLFQRVNAIELTFVQKRIPRGDGPLPPVSGVFYLDGVQLVDWYAGSYDNSRFPAGGPINAAQPIVSQGRTQQVAVICAKYGGEDGVRSAIRAMDMMARVQCWDGSWPEIQTRLQGETTHGMILADLARTLEALRDQKCPELKERVRIRHWEMTRDALYEQMIYRAAMSRAPGPMHTWSDTYFSGEGALRGGCNRPMYFTVSQYVTAQVLRNAAWKKQVLAEYDKNMDDLVAYQGITAGGWPIFGEGNRYGGRGLRWGCGYTTDHVFIMAIGSRVTDDERWGVMMRKFDTVVEAMMLADGLRIDGGLSERGRAKSGGLKAPDIVFQEAYRHGATKLAQWGANVSRLTWSQWPAGGSQWPYASSARGYGLGAFLTWLTYDLQAEPEPKDLGHVFPRQWPVWTAVWMNKSGEEVRRSKLIIRPGNVPAVNTFTWEVGQYPVVTGAPVAVELLGENPVEISDVTATGDVSTLVKAAPRFEVTGEGRVEDNKVLLTGSATVEMIYDRGKIAFKVAPVKADKAAGLRVRPLSEPESYKHVYGTLEEAAGLLTRSDTNLADPEVGTTWKPLNCYPNKEYSIGQALDGSPHSAWVIGGFTPGSGLRFSLPRPVPLGSISLIQGDYRKTFDVATRVSVTLADGTSRTLEMERDPGRTFTLDLGGAVSDTLTVTVDAVAEAEGGSKGVGGWAEITISPAGN